MKAPYPSGTAVLLKDAGNHFEVLLLRRNTKLSFHGGAWVFPGGWFDPKDFTDNENDIVGAARNAAVRETREEAGIEILPDNLVLMSRWTTPEGLPKRFIAWFFVATVQDALVKVDGNEILDYRWMRPDSAMDAQRSGEIELPPPTFVTLLALSEYRNAKTALLALAEKQHMIFVPRVLEANNGLCFLYEGDAGYEQQDVNQPGARHRLWAFEDEYKYERFG
ncbi:MAG: NUDIX hydrolase [Desulfobacterales bacterium]|nr:NUDIX hydrolase [Desulfobacterales bacterium]